jgi:DNA-binding response OmpR family regulator/signal recognition particle receptor subunit beta
MNSKTILIIDDEPKNIEVLVSGLVNSQFQVVTSTSGYNGLEKARKLNPDLILMDTELQDLSGIEFTQKLKEDPEITNIPVILLSTREGIQDRLKAYEVGVKDYIIKPLHVREIVGRIKMVLSRIEKRIREQEKIGKLSGALEDKALSDLIEEFSTNESTGILTLTNSTGKSGQVFFREGQVVNAIVGNFRGERAVYQMIPWGIGKYNMVFQEIDIKDEIGVSNLGLLLQARKRLEKRTELLRSLPGLDKIFTISSTFLRIIEKREMSGDVMRFIQMFNGQRSIQKIIDDSFHDDLVTLERIQKMHQQGFLSELIKKAELETKPEEPKKKVEPIFTEEEFKTFQKRVFEHSEKDQNAILIMGVEASGKNEIVQLLTGPTFQTKTLKNQFPHPVSLGKVPINRDSDLTIIGVPVEKNLHLFVDSLEKFMLGYIILVNSTEPESFEYLGYLIKTFRNRYQFPYAIAVSNLRHPKAVSIENLTRQLGLESYEELMPCNPKDLGNIKMLLLNMHSSPSSRSQLNAQLKIGQFSN